MDKFVVYSLHIIFSHDFLLKELLKLDFTVSFPLKCFSYLSKCQELIRFVYEVNLFVLVYHHKPLNYNHCLDQTKNESGKSLNEGREKVCQCK